VHEFHIDGEGGRSYSILVEEVDGTRPDLAPILLDIDLQTFSEPTFSSYSAAALLHGARVFLLRADANVIGTCVCLRTWERPDEALLLSMGVRPGWRGRGLGQRFLAEVLTVLHERGLRAVRLLVSRDNRRAFALYRDVGFQEADVVEDSRSGERFVVMRTDLPHTLASTAP